MESSENQSDALLESDMGLEFNTTDRCEYLDATPCVGKDEEMVESCVNGLIESNTGLEPDSTDCGVVVDAVRDEEMMGISAGALVVECHVDGNDEMVENFPGKDFVSCEGDSIPEPSESEDEYAKTSRFNDLCQRAIKFATDGAASVNTYRVALRALERALEEVALAGKNGVIEDQLGTSVSESGIQVNNSADQLVLKSEKRTRKCKICKEDGHYKRTCPVWRSSSDAEELTPTGNSKGNRASLQKISENSLSDNDDDDALDNKNNLVEFVAPLKSIDKVRLKSSNYHGVTRHRTSGRFETHLWDNGCRGDGQKVKGKLVYLGGYDNEEKAARAYDLAALKYWGPSRKLKLNFPISDYEKELEEMKDKTREEFVMSIRRKSDRFTRGSSIYKGVTRRQSDGKWQARIGPCNGNKDFYYLGTYSTEREAAEAYDVACIELRGLKAVTNFDIGTYCEGGWKELEEFCRQKVVMSKWKQNYDESRVAKKL